MGDNNYTNTMRMAVRTIKNPTPIPVDVVQHSDSLELRVASEEMFNNLTVADKMNFLSYLHTLSDYMSSEGATVYVSGVGRFAQ